MKLLLLLAILAVSSDDKILEQGSSFVPVSDMDGYIYLLNPDKRAGFINDQVQFEKNLITMLNINIVDNYIKSNGLIKHEAFENIEKVVDDLSVDLDDEFYIKLGLEKDIAYRSVKDFITKKERFIKLNDFIKYNLLDGKIEQYVKEQFILNKSQWIIPEKKDLSMIQLDLETYDAKSAKNILSELLEKDNLENFSQYAAKYSVDASVNINQGHLKQFRQKDLNYPFAEAIFVFGSVGVIPNLFKYDGKYYLVRVNQIIPEVKPEYQDYKQQITERILPDLVSNEMQRIINTEANNEIKINPEVLAHVFERYHVLIEE